MKQKRKRKRIPVYSAKLGREPVRLTMDFNKNPYTVREQLRTAKAELMELEQAGAGMKRAFQDLRQSAHLLTDQIHLFKNDI